MRNYLKTFCLLIIAFLFCLPLDAQIKRATRAKSFIGNITTNAWAARHNLSGSQYQSAYNQMKGKGYRLTYISGYEVNGQARYAAIWEKKSGPAMATHHGMSSNAYQQKYNTYSKQGYRLTHISAFDVKGVDYYSAIWEKKSGPAMVARHRMNSSKYQQEFNTWRSKGYRLKKVSGYAIKGVPYFAAIWEKTGGPAMTTHHGMNASVYQQKFNSYSRSGYRVVHLSAYTVKGKDYYAAIWEKKSGKPYAARHLMTSANYQSQFDNFKYTGYRLKLVTGYNIGGKARFGAIWESYGMKVSDLNKIDQKVSYFIKKYNIPGIQIAISKNEKLVYAKGFGKADKENNILMGPNHKGRIASISKPITSAAIMKLDAKDSGFSLNSKVIGPGSIFGNAYGNKPLSNREKNIRVVNLLEHTAGANVWDNNRTLEHSNTDPKAEESPKTSDPMFQQTSYNHSQLFTWVLDNRNPDYNPGSYYAYSNFGYSMLGRIIEKRTNQNYETWVRNNILKPAGAGGMFISNNAKSQKRPNEMVYYGQGGNPYAANVKRMDSHGGWAGSVIDLLRFMARVDGKPGKKDIISASAVVSMKKRTSYTTNPVFKWGYGKGWGLRSDGGVNHTGALTGTYSLLEYRADGIGIAIIANSRSGSKNFGSDFYNLGQDVVKLISSWPSYDLF